MSEDIEERFREACSDYLAAVEEWETACGAEALASGRARAARQLADEARDQLVQVVRERDLQAQPGACGPAGGPVGDGWDEQRRSHYSRLAADGGIVTEVMRPEDTDWWAKHGGMCPECGISWREPSADCPHKIVNWHPKH